MINPFNKVMAQKSDTELIKILTVEQNDYKQEAILAAREEFDKRGLSKEKIEVAQAEIHYKQDISKAKSEEPLDDGYKFIAFLFPGVILFMFAEKYRVEGYLRKSKELTKFTIYGFCFYVGLIILFSIL